MHYKFNFKRNEKKKCIMNHKTNEMSAVALKNFSNTDQFLKAGRRECLLAHYQISILRWANREA